MISRFKQNKCLLLKRNGRINCIPHWPKVEIIEADSDRDRWFAAEEAKEYGFVDHVVKSAGQVAGSGGTAR